MAWGDPPPDVPRWPPQERDVSGVDVEEQWFFQFNEHLLLTVQAIHRLREAMAARMP